MCDVQGAAQAEETQAAKQVLTEVSEQYYMYLLAVSSGVSCKSLYRATFIPLSPPETGNQKTCDSQ